MTYVVITPKNAGGISFRKDFMCITIEIFKLHALLNDFRINYD